MSTQKYTIGVDIGGSHITCMAMDMIEKKIIKETLKRENLSHTDTTENIFRTWAKAINECIQEVGYEHVKGIGFAIPGPFNYREGISMMQHKYPNLFQLHIPTELKKYLIKNDLPMRFLNDASAFAVGVSWIGKGKNYPNVVVITLGTGFGSAYIQEGLPIISGDAVAPEGCFWHVPFKDGIADDYFSTRWFTQAYEKLTKTPIKGVKEIIATDKSEQLFNEFGVNLGEFITPWLTKFEADILIMGGNISLAYPHFQNALEQTLSKHSCSVKIEISDLMEDAAIAGASRLFEEEFWQKIADNLPNI